MQQLLYAGEVKSMKDLEIPATEVKPAELKLAQQLIQQQSSDTFDPSQYTDEVSARIEKAVEAKVEGQEIVMQDEPEKGAQVIDLMEALRASLDRKAPAKGKPAPRERETATVAAAPERKGPKRVQAAQPAPATTRKAAKKL
jgi:DNA end-binding protein Ku